MSRTLVLPVLQQHIDDLASMRQARAVLLRAPHAQLRRLRRMTIALPRTSMASLLPEKCRVQVAGVGVR